MDGLRERDRERERERGSMLPEGLADDDEEDYRHFLITILEL